MGRQEEKLVESIRRRFPNFSRGLGIGDDAALLEARGTVVITNDMLIEDVDFTAAIPIEFVARKSLAVNLSDLAAMGASPVAYVLALGIPPDYLPQMTRFLDALAVFSQEHHIELIGGDISAAVKLTISISAFGELTKHRAILRTGARPGDRLYVSRPIGGAAAGLELLRRGWSVASDGSVQPPRGLERAVGYSQREFAQSAIRQQVAPTPELELGSRLAEFNSVSSCIDLSDGLSTDLHNLCAASAVGAVIDWERLPAYPDLVAAGRTLGINSERAVLHGGEDYALLFTSSELEAELSGRLGRPVYKIGRITRERGLFLERNEKREDLPNEGFDHFA